MTPSQRFVIVVAVAVGAFLFGAASTWLYDRAARFDASGGLATTKSRIMHRKSDAMQDVLDSVLVGNLGRAGYSLQRLEQSAAQIEFFLETTMYKESGEAFRAAIEALYAAVERNDWADARDATLALEESCLSCHEALLARAE